MTIAGALALATDGCFLSSPPELSEPERTRPNLFDLTPANTQFNRLPVGVLTSFSARVQSEDAGVPLLVVLVLNYDTSSPFLKGVRTLPPSTLDDTRRVLTMQWAPAPSDAGCQQMTMLVTHQDNFVGGETGTEVLNANDVALATWWLHVDDGSTVSVDDCRSNVGAQP